MTVNRTHLINRKAVTFAQYRRPMEHLSDIYEIASSWYQLPSGWETKPTKYGFAVLNGSTPSSSEQSYWDGDIHWATPEDIGSLRGRVLRNTRRKITEAGYDHSGTQIAPEGSIILTTRAPVGNLALSGIPLCTNQGCKTLVPRSKKFDSGYFYYQFLARKEELGALAAGTTFQELGTEELRAFEIWIPSRSEQRAIADFLDRETAKIDELISEKRRLIELLAEKRRALITHAVTSGLDPDVPMHPSGAEWLGEIPRHWMKQFARWLFEEVDERSNTGEGELLTVSHLTGVTLRSEKEVNMFMAETLEGYKICRPGDLVINTLWAWMGAMGVAFQHGLVSPAYNVYRPLGQLEPRFVDYLVRIPIFAQEVTRYSKGVWSSRLRLYPEEFFQVVLPVPPVGEQRIIVDSLDRETEKMDSLNATTQETIKLLRERRAALISAAVTGQVRVRAES